MARRPRRVAAGSRRPRRRRSSSSAPARCGRVGAAPARSASRSAPSPASSWRHSLVAVGAVGRRARRHRCAVRRSAGAARRRGRLPAALDRGRGRGRAAALLAQPRRWSWSWRSLAAPATVVVQAVRHVDRVVDGRDRRRRERRRAGDLPRRASCRSGRPPSTAPRTTASPACRTGRCSPTASSGPSPTPPATAGRWRRSSSTSTGSRTSTTPSATPPATCCCAAVADRLDRSAAAPRTRSPASPATSSPSSCRIRPTAATPSSSRSASSTPSPSPITVAEERIIVGGSVGIAVHPNDGATADELLASADAAMYRAKENGGNGYELFSAQLATQAHERLRLEAALLDGMERRRARAALPAGRRRRHREDRRRRGARPVGPPRAGPAAAWPLRAGGRAVRARDPARRARHPRRLPRAAPLERPRHHRPLRVRQRVVAPLLARPGVARGRRVAGDGGRSVQPRRRDDREHRRGEPRRGRRDARGAA